MPYIKAEDIVVNFPIYNASHRSLKTTVLRATTGGRIGRDSGNRVIVRALDHLSFEIREGDRVGLVGQNGSGKTTLLRVLSGIYEPQGGYLEVKGRTATLLDLSLGIDPEATGYDNIVFRGILAGLHPKAIKAESRKSPTLPSSGTIWTCLFARTPAECRFDSHSPPQRAWRPTFS